LTISILNFIHDSGLLQITSVWWICWINVIPSARCMWIYEPISIRGKYWANQWPLLVSPTRTKWQYVNITPQTSINYRI